MKTLKNRRVWWSLLVLCLAALDLLTKYIALSRGRVLVNTGISFGLLDDVGQVFWVVTGLILCVFIFMVWGWMEKRRGSVWSVLALCLILAGGLANTISRVLWAGVYDWICVWKFPCFNLADIMIDVGAVALFFMFFVWRIKGDGLFKRYS